YPLGSFFLTVGIRALFGFICLLFYFAARCLRWSGFWFCGVSFLGRTIHSVLVFCTLWSFFSYAGYVPATVVDGFFSFHYIFSNLISAGLVLLFWYLFHTRTWNQFVQRIEAAKAVQITEHYHLLSLMGIILLALLSSVAVAFYFVGRMESVLTQKGIVLS